MSNRVLKSQKRSRRKTTLKNAKCMPRVPLHEQKLTKREEEILENAVAAALYGTFGVAMKKWTFDFQMTGRHKGGRFILTHSSQMHSPLTKNYLGSDSTFLGEQFRELFVPTTFGSTKPGGFYLMITYSGEPGDNNLDKWIDEVMNEIVMPGNGEYLRLKSLKDSLKANTAI